VCLDPQLAYEFLQAFPHPVFLFDPQGELLGANPAGIKLADLEERPRKKCYEVLYDRKQRCPKCPRKFNTTPFWVNEVAPGWFGDGGAEGNDSFILSMGTVSDEGHGLGICKVLMATPAVLRHLRKLHEFATELESRTQSTRSYFIT